MKRKILSALLTVAMLATILTGCGSKEEASSIAGESNDVNVEVNNEEVNEKKEESVIENLTQELEETEMFESESVISSYEDIEDLLGKEIAEDVEIEGNKYNIFENGAEVSQTSESSSDVIKEEVEYEGNTYPVISMNCDIDYKDIESYEIPAQIKYVHPSIVYTNYVKHITIPETVEFFTGGYSNNISSSESELVSITFPEGIKTDKTWYETFRCCENLKSITIPEGVEKLEASFAHCESLEEVIIPSTVKYLGAGTFSDCLALTEFTIPEGVEEVSSAFTASGLKSLTISSSVKYFHLGALNDCIDFEELIIPETVESVAGKIQNCKSLKRIEVNTVFGEASSEKKLWVYGCPVLETIICPDDVVSLGFDGATEESGCTIFVPSEKVDEFKEDYPEYNIVSK